MQGSTGMRHAGHIGTVTTVDISKDGYLMPSASGHVSCCIRCLRWGVTAHKLQDASCDHYGTVGTSQPVPDCACIPVMCTLAGSFCAFAMLMASIGSLGLQCRSASTRSQPATSPFNQHQMVQCMHVLYQGHHCHHHTWCRNRSVGPARGCHHKHEPCDPLVQLCLEWF